MNPEQSALAVSAASGKHCPFRMPGKARHRGGVLLADEPPCPPAIVVLEEAHTDGFAAAANGKALLTRGPSRAERGTVQPCYHHLLDPLLPFLQASKVNFLVTCPQGIWVSG